MTGHEVTKIVAMSGKIGSGRTATGRENTGSATGMPVRPVRPGMAGIAEIGESATGTERIAT